MLCGQYTHTHTHTYIVVCLCDLGPLRSFLHPPPPPLTHILCSGCVCTLTYTHAPTPTHTPTHTLHLDTSVSTILHNLTDACPGFSSQGALPPPPSLAMLMQFNIYLTSLWRAAVSLHSPLIVRILCLSAGHQSQVIWTQTAVFEPPNSGNKETNLT